MVKLEHIIEFCAYDGEGAPDIDIPFDSGERFKQAEKDFFATIKHSEVSYADLECAGTAFAATAETFGFDKGFRAGIKLVRDLLTM